MKSRMGRPSKEESRRRHEAMLECALDIFLRRGYEETTMLEIANAAGMSKRTLYTNYADKDALFKAAVDRAIARYTIPAEKLAAIATDDLAETLERVAQMRIANVATPAGVRLQRILVTQSYRFPGMDRAAFEESAGPTIDFLSDLFVRLHAAGEIDVPAPRRAAIAFISLVAGGPTRLFISGNRLDDEEIRNHVHFAVGLFLNGIRKR